MKSIYISQGKYALVDDEDFNKVSGYSWIIFNNRKNGNSYAKAYLEIGTREHRKRQVIYMHRLIMKTPMDMQVDHINQNGLDNRKTNLRICTSSQNQANRGKQRNNTSGYKGVYWHDQQKKWLAAISHQGKSFSLGLYVNKEMAAKAYNLKAIELHGEFARLNHV